MDVEHHKLQSNIAIAITHDTYPLYLKVSWATGTRGTVILFFVEGFAGSDVEQQFLSVPT